MTEKQWKRLLKAQQGELDAVAMYQALARKVKDPHDAEIFRQLAAEEGRHAGVFHSYTGKVMRPKPTKAILLPILYSLIGREKLYPIIADGEYKAVKKYEALIGEFENVRSVQTDEQRHGDIVLALLKAGK